MRKEKSQERKKKGGERWSGLGRGILFMPMTWASVCVYICI